MFFNLYRRRVKIFALGTDTAIWLYVVPFVLATMFWLCFQNLDNVRDLHTIPVAVINNETYQSDISLSIALAAAEATDGTPLFDIRPVKTADEAAALLENGDVTGIITPGNPASMTVDGNGINQTVIKVFLDRHEQTKARIVSIIKQNPAAATNIEALIREESFTIESPLTSAAPSPRASYYYALLAMICMYGSFVGMDCATKLQANLSDMGARRVISPVPRMKLVLCDMLAAWTVHFVAISVMLAYVTLVQGIKFGGRVPAMILTCTLGCIVGITFGSAVGCVLIKAKYGVKSGILAVISMACSFFAGLMVGGMNFIVQRDIPLLAAINPAGRVADAFYSLYYYESYSRFWGDIRAMAVMAVLFVAITVILIRRQRYESI